MTLSNFIILISVAVSYFYFNWRYFMFVKELRQMPRYPYRTAILGFFINYSLFIICSSLELHLILNWSLFAIFLYLETMACSRGGPRCALFGTLACILLGLSINIFCRNFVAIMIGQPLVKFDNRIYQIGNIKSVPLLLGFFLSGIAMRLMARPGYIDRQRLILGHPQHIHFLLNLMGGMFLYLYLNLLLYQAHSNSLILKLWGIKSCVFSMMGFFIGLHYAFRICELEDYRDKNRGIQQKLVEQKWEEKQLKNVVSRDTLTGLYNRQKANEVIGSLLSGNSHFILCFVDLDGLKTVNDQYGHDHGDRYLLTVTREMQRICRKNTDQIFRYGGDEFIVLFKGLTLAAAEARAAQLNERLSSLGDAPYPMSVSYGVVGRFGFSDIDALVEAADSKMYQQKQKKHMCRT